LVECKLVEYKLSPSVCVSVVVCLWDEDGDSFQNHFCPHPPLLIQIEFDYVNRMISTTLTTQLSQLDRKFNQFNSYQPTSQGKATPFNFK